MKRRVGLSECGRRDHEEGSYEQTALHENPSNGAPEFTTTWHGAGTGGFGSLLHFGGANVRFWHIADNVQTRLSYMGMANDTWSNLWTLISKAATEEMHRAIDFEEGF